MKSIAEYEGRLLGHVEALYRPGERELAIELVQALGCAISDTGFKGDAAHDTFLAVHPDPEDKTPGNNVFYISEIRPEQLALEDGLKRLSAENADVAVVLAGYREVARTKPFGVPHFALRFRSGQEIEAAADRLNGPLREKLGERLHFRIFRPDDPDAAVPGTITQAFLYQDVIVSGSFLMGQLIELQARA